MELFGSMQEDFKRIYDSHVHNCVRNIAEVIQHEFKFSPVPNTMHRYIIRLMVIDTDKYALIRNQIRDILRQKLDIDTYKLIGELFKKLEQPNENPLS
jgi:hypothetical protein